MTDGPRGHLASHKRAAFLAWVDAGFPQAAEIEIDYEKQTVSSVDLLRMFILPEPCTDYMPIAARRAVLAFLGHSEDAAPLAYGLAAVLLLAHRWSVVTGVIEEIFSREAS